MNKIEKLELKHLCGYLPHGLKFKDLGCIDGDDDIATLTQIDTTYNTVADSDGNFDILLREVKPLLLPMSALDTQNLIDDLHGKMSDAIFDWIDYFNSDSENTDMAILCAPYPIIEWCFKNHFDIYGLIPAGLAIDKRTVKL